MQVALELLKKRPNVIHEVIMQIGDTLRINHNDSIYEYNYIEWQNVLQKYQQVQLMVFLNRSKVQK